MASHSAARHEHDWLWGWDPTPGIVSVWAELDGRAFVWRRDPTTHALVRDDVRFRPWLLLSSLADIEHLGDRLQPEGGSGDRDATTFRELAGAGELRWLVRAHDGRRLTDAVLLGASRRLGQRVRHLRELPSTAVLSIAPEEQYLVATGRSYFRDLPFSALRRMQLDLETTGLEPSLDRIFLIAIAAPNGDVETLEAEPRGQTEEAKDAAEAQLIRRLTDRIDALDPDVIENHNLHGFDLPFLAERARLLGVPLELGRTGPSRLLRRRPTSRRSAPGRAGADQRFAGRYTASGRELFDTMDAVLRYDFAARDLPGHGLKAVARHFGLSTSERELIPGAQVHAVYERDPERVRRYAADDVREARRLAELLSGSTFALARMAPRRYERLADAGPATGVLDPLLVRAYLRSGAALPAHVPGDDTAHSGAALHLFATGVAVRIVKADVASLYPSLMRSYRIGPARDRLGVLVSLVDRLVEQRLTDKRIAREAPAGSVERHTHEALSAAMKLLVNSAYGYLAAAGLTRFADVHAANEVTRRGREVLATICHELAARGVTLLEADTDGVYFSVPANFEEADERRVVREVGSCLPPGIQLEFEGRYAAMLSHEPKNYALLPYGGGPILLRGVAFRSSRSEPFGERFLEKAITRLLHGDLVGVRNAYVEMHRAIATRSLPTFDVTSRVRLSKSPEEYRSSRIRSRELPYEAMLNSGAHSWAPGARLRVYRALGGRAARWHDPDETADAAPVDRRDYDVAWYLKLLRETYAARLERALEAEDHAAIIADPDQPSLFTVSLAGHRPVLRLLDSSGPAG